MVLVKEELGSDWLTNCYFRIGASSLLDDIINDINETYNNVTLQNTEEENLKNENRGKIEKKPKSPKSKKES